MRWTFWLNPGMWLMRKMRFGSKLGLVSAIAILPLLVVVWQVWVRNVADLQVTRAEVHGVEVVEKATELVRFVQTHRGQHNLVLLGNSQAKVSRDQTRAALTESIATVDKLATSSTGWGDLHGRLKVLLSQTESLNAAQSYLHHTALIEDLSRFVYGVADTSGLLYDPDPQTYLLMDMSVSRLIALREHIGRLRSAGTGLLNNGDMDAGGVARVEVMVDELVSLAADLQYSQNIIANKGFKDPAGDAAQAQVAQFVKLTRDTFKWGEPAGNPQPYFEAGAKAIGAIGEYHQVVNRTMVNRLKEREAAIERNLAFVAVISALAVVLLVYLMLAFNISFLADLRQVMRFMQETASGNMRHKARMLGRDELSDMSRSMAVMVNNISVMVSSVRSNAALVSNLGDVLVRGNHSLSDRTVQQAANLEQTSASVQQLVTTVRENANAAQQSDQAAQGVREVAERGARGMEQAIASIEAIEASTRRMDEIVGVIDGLAFQTNILALNAAVEAARAGESGRGFAVVAAEVRSLAKRSADSAKEIRQLITTSSTQVEAGVAQIRAAGQSISAIVSGVRGVAENVSLISTSSAEQSESLSEISTAIAQLDQITQQNGAMVEQAVNQSTALQTQAHLLSDAALMFQLPQGSADEARQLVERALELHSSCTDRDHFLREVTAPHSGLSDRDMYVFVLDARGQYLAFAGNSSKVGTRVQDVPGIDGAALIHTIVSQADVAPSWVEYEIVNPQSGQVQEKMSYVVKVDGVYVGCGVYKNMVQTI